jgi:hypothetical protein
MMVFGLILRRARKRPSRRMGRRHALMLRDAALDESQTRVDALSPARLLMLRDAVLRTAPQHEGRESSA